MSEAPAAPAPVAFAYDMAGNLTADGGNAFTYDALNRLTRAVMNDNAAALFDTVDFAYDAFGRRTQKIVTPAGGGGATFTTDYIYDGDYAIAEYLGGILTTRLVYGAGVDQLVVA